MICHRKSLRHLRAADLLLLRGVFVEVRKKVKLERIICPLQCLSTVCSKCSVDQIF